MGSLSKKYKKYNIRMSIKFICPKCNNTKVISQEIIQSIKKEKFKNHDILNVQNIILE